MEKKNNVIHVLLWVFVFGLTFDSLTFDYELEMALLLSFTECAINAIISYVNLLILIPNILQKKGMRHYILSILAFFVILFLPYFLSDLGVYLLSEDPGRIFVSFALNFTIFIMVSFLFWKVNEYEREKKRNLELSNEKLKAELQLLKSQVSPHFLFNTLNNIYSLSITKDDNTPLMIEKLSDLLRYIIYEGEQALVPLDREVELLKNYTELQQLKKLKGGENIKFNTKGVQRHHQITPLLLINIVENCFKHGDIAFSTESMLSIDVTVENDQLQFQTVNSFKASNKKEGIGLKNVQEQLKHHYPDRHQFHYETEGNKYTTHLQIDLK